MSEYLVSDRDRPAASGITIEVPDPRMDPPPQSAFEIDVKVTGETWESAVRILTETLMEIERHGPECSSVGGGGGGSHSVTIRTRDVDPETYRAELRAWCERGRERRKATP